MYEKRKTPDDIIDGKKSFFLLPKNPPETDKLFWSINYIAIISYLHDEPGYRAIFTFDDIKSVKVALNCHKAF